MKRREAIKKWVLGGTLIALTPGILTKCTKDEFERASGQAGGLPQVLNIDLNAPEYAVLKNPGSSMVFASEKIIVANSISSGFIAATCKCPHGGTTLKFDSNPSNSGGVWRCPGHGSGFNYGGACLCGPSKQNLKVYSIGRKGNILEITLL